MFFIISDEWRRQNCCKAISSITEYGKYSVEIKPYKRRRTDAQRRFMGHLYTAICEYTGNNPKDLHEQMKVTLLGVDRKTIAGQAIIMPKSTKDLETQEMTEFIRAIEALAIELEVKPPTNDEYDYAMGGK